MTGMIDPFADAEAFNKARPSEGGVYFIPGQYEDVEIEKVCLIKSQSNGHVLFIAETKIHLSDVPGRKPGSKCSMIVSFEKISAMGNVRTFVAAAIGQPFEATTADVCRGVCSAANPLKGTRMSFNCFMKDSRNGVFVDPADGQTKKRRYLKYAFTLRQLSPAMAEMYKAA